LDLGFQSKPSFVAFFWLSTRLHFTSWGLHTLLSLLLLLLLSVRRSPLYVFAALVPRSELAAKRAASQQGLYCCAWRMC
jgi:hypothetical protein